MFLFVHVLIYLIKEIAIVSFFHLHVRGEQLTLALSISKYIFIYRYLMLAHETLLRWVKIELN